MKAWTTEETELAVKLWNDGNSAARIVNVLNATFGTDRKRNSVLGRVHRKRGLFVSKGQGSSRNRQNLRPGNIAGKREGRVFDPGKPVKTADAIQCRRVPLFELGSRECRWPVNDAATPGEHLFCGLHADIGTYCSHHFLRSIGSGTESERSAHRSLQAEAIQAAA